MATVIFAFIQYATVPLVYLAYLIVILFAVGTYLSCKFAAETNIKKTIFFVVICVPGNIYALSHEIGRDDWQIPYIYVTSISFIIGWFIRLLVVLYLNKFSPNKSLKQDK